MPGKTKRNRNNFQNNGNSNFIYLILSLLSDDIWWSIPARVDPFPRQPRRPTPQGQHHCHTDHSGHRLQVTHTINNSTYRSYLSQRSGHQHHQQQQQHIQIILVAGQRVQVTHNNKNNNHRLYLFSLWQQHIQNLPVTAFWSPTTKTTTTTLTDYSRHSVQVTHNNKIKFTKFEFNFHNITYWELFTVIRFYMESADV